MQQAPGACVQMMLADWERFTYASIGRGMSLN